MPLRSNNPNGIGKVRYSVGPISRRRGFKSRIPHYPVHESRCATNATGHATGFFFGGVMDEIAHLELSPGSIRTEPCARCGNDALVFDTVALRDTGVAWAGTIHRCGFCERNI